MSGNPCGSSSSANRSSRPEKPKYEAAIASSRSSGSPPSKAALCSQCADCPLQVRSRCRSSLSFSNFAVGSRTSEAPLGHSVRGPPIRPMRRHASNFSLGGIGVLTTTSPFASLCCRSCRCAASPFRNSSRAFSSIVVLGASFRRCNSIRCHRCLKALNPSARATAAMALREVSTCA